MKISCEDQVILNQWHPISSLDVLTVGVIDNTVLLDSKISYQKIFFLFQNIMNQIVEMWPLAFLA